MTSQEHVLSQGIWTSRRWRLGIVFVVAGALAVAGGLYLGLGRSDAGADGGTLLAVTLPDIQGTPQSLAQWKGKIIVVNFWATWCTPCREEMPEFVRTQRQLGPKGVQFVGIAVDSVDKVAQFADEIHLNYPALVGGYGAMELSKAMGNSLMALPFTVVIDREGRVAHRQLGPLRDAKLRTIVGNLL